MKRFIGMCLVSVILFGPSRLIRGEEFIESLKKLDDELFAESRRAIAGNNQFDVFSWDDLKELDVAKKIEYFGLPVWFELLEGLPNTLSQHVAYNCIARHAVQFQTQAAFLLLLSSEQPSIISRRSPAGKHLRTLEPTRDNINALSFVLSRSYTKETRGKIAFLISELPEEFVKTWIQQEHNVVVPPRNEAIVLNWLLARRAKESNAAISGVFARKLLDYIRLTGYPRIVFLLYGQNDDPTILRGLKSTMADESISDGEFETVVFVHKEYTRKILAELLSVPGETAMRRGKRLSELLQRD